MEAPTKQDWNAERYQRDAGFVARLGQGVVELLAPRPGERILDLGCGDGTLTEIIAGSGAEVIGSDSAPDMVAASKARGLDARLMDGHELAFDAPFDAVFTNAALHWMTQPDRVLDSVSRALKPGGRFVGEFGGHGNVAAIRTALHEALSRRQQDPLALSPWYFPSPNAYARRLENHGFQVEEIYSFPRPTPLPSDLPAWLEIFAQAFLAPFSENERSEILEEVTDRLRPILCDEEGNWTADYVRLRFSARREG
ncbi:MAG: class I SAM-dependent methyltransferase [Pseudomonadota bacterium]